MANKKSCENCRMCLLVDFGYSNWTVEGTTVYCMAGLHPDKEFDRWYGTDERLFYAEKCEGFIEGGCETLDVDKEDFEELTGYAMIFLANKGVV